MMPFTFAPVVRHLNIALGNMKFLHRRCRPNPNIAPPVTLNWLPSDLQVDQLRSADAGGVGDVSSMP